jgi:hypothetical protein
LSYGIEQGQQKVEQRAPGERYDKDEGRLEPQIGSQEAGGKIEKPAEPPPE